MAVDDAASPLNSLLIMRFCPDTGGESAIHSGYTYFSGSWPPILSSADPATFHAAEEAMLSQKDYESFHVIVRGSNFISDDFEIGTVDYIDQMERLYPEFTRVFILHKASNVTTRYVAGCGAYWLRMLERDIEKGVFNVI